MSFLTFCHDSVLFLVAVYGCVVSFSKEVFLTYFLKEPMDGFCRKAKAWFMQATEPEPETEEAFCYGAN